MYKRLRDIYINKEQILVLLDRDGTLIENIRFLKKVSDIKIKDRVIESLRKLDQVKYKLVVVTNQSGISRGLVTVEEVDKIHKNLKKLFAMQGVKLENFVYCPHQQIDNCICRKPRSQMIVELIKLSKANNNQVYYIGDNWTDILASHNFVKKTYLISNQKDSNQIDFDNLLIVQNFGQAIDDIIFQSGSLKN